MVGHTDDTVANIGGGTCFFESFAERQHTGKQKDSGPIYGFESFIGLESSSGHNSNNTKDSINDKRDSFKEGSYVWVAFKDVDPQRIHKHKENNESKDQNGYPGFVVAISDICIFYGRGGILTANRTFGYAIQDLPTNRGHEDNAQDKDD